MHTFLAIETALLILRPSLLAYLFVYLLALVHVLVAVLCETLGRYTSSRELKHLGTTQFPDDPKPDPPIPFEEGTISYAGTFWLVPLPFHRVRCWC